MRFSFVILAATVILTTLGSAEARAENKVVAVNPDEITVKRENVPGLMNLAVKYTVFYIDGKKVAQFYSDGQAEDHEKIIRLIEQEKVLAKKQGRKIDVDLGALRNLELKMPPFAYSDILNTSIGAFKTSAKSGTLEDELNQCRATISQLKQITSSVKDPAISSSKLVKDVKAILENPIEDHKSSGTRAD